MNKQKIQNCMNLSEAILMAHYQGCHEILYEYLHHDILWIDSFIHECYDGELALMQAFEKKEQCIPRLKLSLRQFRCINNDRNCCTIVGRYMGNSDSEEIYQDQQFVTFIWKEVKNELFLIHVHISIPFSTFTKNSGSSTKVKRYTKEYLKMLIQKEVKKSGILKIKDIENIIRMIQVDSIIYLEGSNVNTIVHTEHDRVTIRMLLSETEESIEKINPGVMIRVHKSYSVNRFYINSIRRYKLGVADMFEIPVSKNRYLEIKSELYDKVV